MHLREVPLPRPFGGADRLLLTPTTGAPLCLFLDGGFYLDRVGALDLLEGVDAAFLPAGTPADRHRNFAGNLDFADFLAHTVAPLVRTERGEDPEQPLIAVGVSLSALMTATLGSRHPDRFPAVVCQSPSAWWQEEWLAAQLGDPLAAAWISVGDRETETDVRHPPTDMHQQTSQIDSCRRLSAAWKQAGGRCRFSVYGGGHEAAPWREELPEALRWAVAEAV